MMLMRRMTVQCRPFVRSQHTNGYQNSPDIKSLGVLMSASIGLGFCMIKSFSDNEGSNSSALEPISGSSIQKDYPSKLTLGSSSAVLHAVSETSPRENSFRFSEKSPSGLSSSCDAAASANASENLTAEDLSSILGTLTLLRAGSEVPVSTLVNKTIVLYFSAHWCPPCRRFTPFLVQLYLALKQTRGEEMEFVFMSADNDESAFEEYRKEMPWLAVPFSAAEQRQQSLRSFFGVQGVPWLVTISPDGSIANANAVGNAMRDPEGRSFPWKR